MKLPRLALPGLFRTTAVRLALRYTLLYALALGIALLALAWSVSHRIDTRVQEELEQEMSSLEQTFASGGAAALREAMSQRERDAGDDGRFRLLAARSGERLAGNLLGWPEDLATGEEVHAVQFEEEIIPYGIVEDDVYWPAIARELADGSRLLLARQVEQNGELQEIADYLAEFFLAALLLALAIGITIGHVISRRVDMINRTAGEIMAGDLSQRITVSGSNDEFDVLAGHLNRMLDRIQQLIKGIRQTTDNVAHDLRSPLTRLRNQLEVTLLEPRSEGEYRAVLTRGVEDVESLIRTFNALLEIAQAEAGNHRAQRETIEFDKLTGDLVDLYRPVAEEQGQRLELDARACRIVGNRQLLAQAIGNLLDNAIKYTPADGAIRVSVGPTGSAVEFRIADTGPGIPASEREHVLERFVRLDGARQAPGNGLGLSLVHAVCKLHGAELLLADAGPGLSVTIRLPGGTGH